MINKPNGYQRKHHKKNKLKQDKDTPGQFTAFGKEHAVSHMFVSKNVVATFRFFSKKNVCPTFNCIPVKICGLMQVLSVKLSKDVLQGLKDTRTKMYYMYLH